MASSGQAAESAAAERGSDCVETSFHSARPHDRAMMNTAEQPEAPPSDVDSSASDAMDSAHERAYGTFEVSVIEVESDAETQALVPSKAVGFDARGDDDHHLCSGDCCALVSFFWLPFRLEIYEIVLFHLVNALFAIGASVWTVVFSVVKVILKPISPLSPFVRRLDAATFRVLLHADAVLYNSVAPRSERIVVYNSSASRDGDSVYGFSPRIYFAVAKLFCSAIPGAVAGVTLFWMIRAFLVALVSGAPATPTDPMAPVENDVLILLALVGVYAAAALVKVFAAISRHITVFFCAEHLLYASPL